MGSTNDARAVIFGCSGLHLSDDERQFFSATNPLGFILFARNCAAPDQVRDLVSELRRSVGREDAPVLIDQEGGRVQRLQPPHWRKAPAARIFGDLYGRDPQAALEAIRLNAALIADELIALGITVDCAPVLDVPQPGAHDIIGDRAASADGPALTALAGSACDGFLEQGVLPVIKHIPGHGRAAADSHEELPVVTASRAELAAVDLAPFRALAGMPWAMTAHVIYTAFDDASPATTSKTVISDVIRGEIGFDGVLVSDDLSMKALSGGYRERAAASLAAGCDVVLHCNGEAREMTAVAEGVGVLSDDAAARVQRAEQRRTQGAAATEGWDRDAALARLDYLLPGGGR